MDDQQEMRCENCIVRQLNSLKALTRDELKTISDSKVTKSIKKGDAIFQEGERLNGVFCVRNGVSKLSKMSDNGKDTIVKIATKGEVLGQRSVITEEKTNLSAVALNDMQVCYIPKKHLSDSLNITSLDKLSAKTSTNFFSLRIVCEYCLLTVYSPFFEIVILLNLLPLSPESM